MRLGSLKPASGSKKKRKRIGCGPGSGHGKTATRGNKGTQSRTGNTKHSWYEGGQMPLQRRLPKRGFTNIFRKEWSTVSVEALERLFKAGENVTLELLKETGVVRKGGAGVKILGTGEIKKNLVVSAHKFTEGAKKKIEAAGGRCEVVAAS